VEWRTASTVVNAALNAGYFNMSLPGKVDLAWFEQLPKVELHLHLEGAIPHATIWDLLQQHGGDASVPTRESLAQKFVYRDFRHFIETWTWLTVFLRDYDTFSEVRVRCNRGGTC
jgi:adenosine deaminase